MKAIELKPTPRYSIMLHNIANNDIMLTCRDSSAGSETCEFTFCTSWPTDPVASKATYKYVLGELLEGSSAGGSES